MVLVVNRFLETRQRGKGTWKIKICEVVLVVNRFLETRSSGRGTFKDFGCGLCGQQILREKAKRTIDLEGYLLWSLWSTDIWDKDKVEVRGIGWRIFNLGRFLLWFRCQKIFIDKTKKRKKLESGEFFMITKTILCIISINNIGLLFGVLCFVSLEIFCQKDWFPCFIKKNFYTILPQKVKKIV